ncbi:TPA: hypothetical protein QDC20_000329 [Burkholderia aenigmatica]|uniref:hypothetical protein n=1 Tax=Burkholderia sp. AU45251 TaxID=3059204 RepID=UPI00264BB909|nr:hypothetical protein [Burkholderia sp. AU45251]HDR9483230.1 hypothetical protein [Burkholderia aenigmatica]MDN7516095.1 hypothetical protein [Burkholderia sp. AU45251]HDR9514178.1 hypothetical protein [Burkholderia aenigmatica]HDR9591568.1 hypothetical protein [Burkholderia aenigmatica]HDR9598660.1 hypothetical protein [Burkholderia aenigmatica]
MSQSNIALRSVLEIEALTDLSVQKDDNKVVRVFTRGKKYKVLQSLDDLHVIDDTGTDNLVGGEYLHTNFILHQIVGR